MHKTMSTSSESSSVFENLADIYQFEYDLKELRNRATYQTTPILLSSLVFQSRFLCMNRLFTEAPRVCDFLLYNVSPLNALLHIKFIIDWAFQSEIDIPNDYIELHCRIIDTHTPEELQREDPIYETNETIEEVSEDEEIKDNQEVDMRTPIAMNV